jgi:hypothetical protein
MSLVVHCLDKAVCDRAPRLMPTMFRFSACVTASTHFPAQCNYRPHNRHQRALAFARRDVDDQPLNSSTRTAKSGSLRQWNKVVRPIPKCSAIFFVVRRPSAMNWAACTWAGGRPICVPKSSAFSSISAIFSPPAAQPSAARPASSSRRRSACCLSHRRGRGQCRRWPQNRDQRALALARWDVDDQPLDLSLCDGLQIIANRVDVDPALESGVPDDDSARPPQRSSGNQLPASADTSADSSPAVAGTLSPAAPVRAP